jgi:hypothetical protein
LKAGNYDHFQYAGWRKRLLFSIDHIWSVDHGRKPPELIVGVGMD